VSLVTPADNEETLIVQSAKAFLASDYAPLEVVDVDDGSKDERFARLDEAFDLVSLPMRGRTALKTAPIRSVHISRTEPKLRVVHKDNGVCPKGASRGARPWRSWTSGCRQHRPTSQSTTHEIPRGRPAMGSFASPTSAARWSSGG
jgi:hypothetical protein